MIIIIIIIMCVIRRRRRLPRGPRDDDDDDDGIVFTPSEPARLHGPGTRRGVTARPSDGTAVRVSSADRGKRAVLRSCGTSDTGRR